MTYIWQNRLSAAFKSSRKGDLPVKIAVVGIGSPFHGDDIAGLQVVRKLYPQLSGDHHVLLVEAGQAPENFTGLIRRFSPDLTLLVDAARMGVKAGEVCWVDWKETQGMSSSTHTLPIYMLAQYLVAEIGCQVGLLGIQPDSVEMGVDPSPAVLKTVDLVAAELIDVINNQD